MPGTYSTSINTFTSLSSSDPFVTITGSGTINAYGSAGVYAIQNNGTLVPQTIDAAIFGHAGTVFTIQNSGLIETGNTVGNFLDVGIALGEPGTVINHGSIIGASGIGMFGTTGNAPGYVDNAGLISGSYGVGIYMHAGSVTNSGSIAGPQNGVEVRAAGASVDNTSTGMIAGTGTGGSGIGLDGGGNVINAGHVSGAQYGIAIAGTSTSVGTVHNSGTIQQTVTVTTNSSYAGIYLQNAGAIYNSLTGDISGLSGIRIGSGTTGYVDNAGTVAAYSTVNVTGNFAAGFDQSGVGVYLAGGGTVVNHGTIAGNHVGIVVEKDAGTVDNTGLITEASGAIVSDASPGYGIYLHEGGGVTNSGTIIGDGQGIFAANTFNILNSGDVDATTKPFVGNGSSYTAISTAIFGLGTGDITNAVGGLVTASFGIGIFLAGFETNYQTDAQYIGAGTLLNAGSVDAQYGVEFDAIGSLVNSGSILGNAWGAELSNQFASASLGVLVNSGLIQAAAGQIVDLLGTVAGVGVTLTGGDIFNLAGGTIAGDIAIRSTDSVAATSYVSAQYFANPFYLSNAGLISGSGDGVDTSGGAGSTIHNSGTIQQIGTSTSGSSYAGIYVRQSGAVFNSISGSISGLSGIRLEGTGSSYIDNAGHITGSHSAGIYFYYGGTVNNTGTIIGQHHGIVVEATSYTGLGIITNSGLIESTTNTFSKDGTIHTGSGISVLAGGTLTNTSQGTIIGANGMYIKAGDTGNPSAIAFNNLGHISGTYKSGIVLGTAGYVRNSGSVFGNDNGVYAGSGAQISNTSAGIITAGGTGIENRSGTLDLQNSGMILATGTVATDNAVDIGTAGAGIILNSGTIENVNGSGVFLQAASSVQNHGLISGKDFGLLASSGDSVSNYGTIQATGFQQFSDFGSLNTPVALKMLGGTATNETGGKISGAYGGVYVGGNGELTNAGEIIGSVAAYIGTGATLDNLSGGVLTALGHVVVGEGSGVTLINAGSIGGAMGAEVSLAAGGTVVNAGTIRGVGTFTDAIDFGTGISALVLDPGQVIIGGVTAQSSFESGLDLASGSSSGIFDMGGTVTGFGEITFETGSTWTLEGSAAELIGLPGPIITGFTAGDSLVIENFLGSITGFSGGGLVLNGEEDVNFQGASLTASDFVATTLDGNTTITTAICYLRGTAILTPTGEKPVEDLRSGDLVVTRFSGLQPVKWIGVQRYAGRFLANNPEKIPVCIAAGALGPNQPAKALVVSPGHAMLVGEVLVLAKNLVNGITITQPAPPETVEYFAIELERHDCVIANGAYGESFADGPGLRNQFHNIDEFLRLFADYAEPEQIMLCRPRPERGAELAIALLPIVTAAAAAASPGVLRGSIDLIESSGLIEGWAQDSLNPDLPVLLEIFEGDTKLGEVLSCDYRDDLASAGIGRGYHMFSFTVPGGLRPKQRRAISIRRAGDGAGIYVSDACQARIKQRA